MRCSASSILNVRATSYPSIPGRPMSQSTIFRQCDELERHGPDSGRVVREVSDHLEEDMGEDRHRALLLDDALGTAELDRLRTRTSKTDRPAIAPSVGLASRVRRVGVGRDPFTALSSGMTLALPSRSSRARGSSPLRTAAAARRAAFVSRLPRRRHAHVRCGFSRRSTFGPTNGRGDGRQLLERSGVGPPPREASGELVCGAGLAVPTHHYRNRTAARSAHDVAGTPLQL
jgi:hypothetical protein